MEIAEGGRPDRRYYLDAMQGNSGLEPVFHSRATEKTLLVFYSPVHYQDEIIGSLTGAYKETSQLVRPCLINGRMPSGESFCRQSRRFDAAILCVSTGNSTRSGGKNPPFGRSDFFQTRPKPLTMDVFGCRAEPYLCSEDGLIIASSQRIDATAEVPIQVVLGPPAAADADAAGMNAHLAKPADMQKPVEKLTDCL